MKWNAKKFITNMICVVSTLLIAWCMLSFFEIICKNTNPNPIYSVHNFFVLIFKGGAM